MDAALDLLAERGGDGVSLREVTGAAQANVAAVSYHFGSLKSLCDAAVEDRRAGQPRPSSRMGSL
jgi:AcrR family transcriptional regulator